MHVISYEDLTVTPFPLVERNLGYHIKLAYRNRCIFLGILLSFMDSPFPPLSSVSNALFLYLINQTALKIAARAAILDSTATVMTPANEMETTEMTFTPVNAVNVWEEISEPHLLQ